jgi:hypothetical protein
MQTVSVIDNSEYKHDALLCERHAQECALIIRCTTRRAVNVAETSATTDLPA